MAAIMRFDGGLQSTIEWKRLRFTWLWVSLPMQGLPSPSAHGSAGADY
jgi:hypothetical protein